MFYNASDYSKYDNVKNLAEKNENKDRDMKKGKITPPTKLQHTMKILFVP